MFTIFYRTWYINGYIDKPECKVLHPNGTPIPYTYKSLHAAKCAISRYMNKGVKNV
jgi:hypothetical protein